MMPGPKLWNYEIVKRTMVAYKDTYLRKGEIAQLTGLDPKQVSRIVKAAWKLGWVTRIERSPNCINNAWGQGKYTAMKTAYKIKRLDTWLGLFPLYKETLENEKKERENSQGHIPRAHNLTQGHISGAHKND